MTSPWLEWARATHQRSFPEGHPALAMPASYYDEVFSGDVPGWRQSKARDVVYLPAAAMCAIAGGPILDVGCGPGVFAELLSEMGIEYLAGIDFSPLAIAGAIRRNINAELCNLKDDVPWYFRDVGYETVAMVEFLEHVYDDLELVAAIPKGRNVVITVPSCASVGHVRWFGSLQEAADRYRPLIHWADGLETRAARGGNRWFIMRGVRR